MRRVGFAAAAALLTVALGAMPARAAAPSGGDPHAAVHAAGARVLAQHMGTGTYAKSAQSSGAITDPTGDVTDARADITSFTGSYGTRRLVLSAKLKQPTDPRTDPLWQGNGDLQASLEFAIDVGDVGFPEYLAFIEGGPRHTVLAGLTGDGYIPDFPGLGGQLIIVDGPGGARTCRGVTGAYAAGTYTISIPTDCIENAPVARVAAGMILIDTSFDSPFPIVHQPIVDVAPDHGAVTLQTVPGGYAMASDDGGVFTFSAAPFRGSLGNVRPAAPITDIVGEPGLRGYTLLGADGGVFTFGSAKYFGSATYLTGLGPWSAIARTTSGNGYWVVSAAGDVFSFGDAGHFAIPALRHPSPAVDAVATPTGHGLWIAFADGGVEALGDAKFFGSAFPYHPTHPIVAIMATPTGAGYALVGADGGVFTFGDARFFGSTGGIHLTKPIVGAAMESHGNGYTLLGSDGGIFTFGNARWFGTGAGFPFLGGPIVGFAAFG